MSRGIAVAPTPSDGYEPGWFRLAGLGGAAVFLRSSVVPAATEGDGHAGAQLVFDVGLLSPGSFTRYQARESGASLPDRLSQFLMSAASEADPELSVAPLIDEVLGLRIEVTSSTDRQVGLLVTVRKEADEATDGDDTDSLDFETTRAAVSQAALDIRFLDHVDGDPGGAYEPPAEWSTS